MKTIIIALGCLVAGFGVAYLLLPVPPTEAITNPEKPQLYTCGMHPEIISDKPGFCPICNMKLTPKRDAQESSGSVRIDPTMKQNMGLVTAPASYRTLTRTINTFGSIQVPDPNIHNVTIKIDGWVERLFVAEEGQRVAKGEPLLEIYSPDLVAAQKELLIAVKSPSENVSVQRLAQSAEQRLRNWDISEDQLRQLKESDKVTRTLIIRSPADGFVKAKTVNVGDRVSAQSVLYEVADLSTVWVEGYVYEQDLPYLRLGQIARVTTPGLPGQTYEAQLAYISPLLDSEGQTEIRFLLDNTGFHLKPQMYADVAVDATLAGARLTVPRSAVINSGLRQMVFVASDDDSYTPRDVITGAVDSQDMTEILQGLEAGESVVVSGQFLLDSESRLREVINSGGTGPHMHQHPAAQASEPSGSMGLPRKPHALADNSDVIPVDDPYDIHTCPMPSHDHVLNYGPGNCPDCGMTLVPIAQTDNAPVYVCPMPECKVAAHEPGNCPVCNMQLIEYEPRHNHDQ